MYNSTGRPRPGEAKGIFVRSGTLTSSYAFNRITF